MGHLQNLKAIALVMLVAMATVSVTSCSNDDETKEAVYHQHYFQGKLNNHDISMNEVNANIMADKSDMDFSSGNQTDIPAWFDWEVTLMETKDTVITLHLHIDDVKRTNEVIYSPKDKDPIKSNSTCYATVKDLKNNTTSVYHPTHPAPINVAWETFMMTVDKTYKNITKQYNSKIEFTGHRWAGIKGSLFGTLTSDDESKSPLKISMEFILY
uniref:Lipoprotein n=1 Tax=Prevotella sp. GTC17254 TaxID=3236794 RepID=A0AB33IXM0_9BACT